MTRSIDGRAGIAAPEREATGRILLLDDEKAIQAPLVRYFAGVGCLVEVAAEAEEAEALIAHQCYDLAIVELRLGRFGDAEGLEILREIRRRGSMTGVIVLSAYVSPEIEEEARRLGAAAVLRKPQALPDLAQLAFVMMERS